MELNRSYVEMKKVLEVFLFLAFTLIVNLYSHSQNQRVVDSLLLMLETGVSDKNKTDIYVQLASEYQNTDSLKTAEYANKAIELANRINYVEGTIDPLYPIGRATIRKGNYAQAEQLFSEMGNLAGQNDYAKGKAKAFYGLGLNYFHLGDFDKALEQVLQSAAINEVIEEQKALATDYILIGILYDKMGNYSKALEYHFQSLKMNETLGNKLGMAASYTNIGIIYKNQGDYEKALEYYRNSSQLNEELGRKAGIASNYTNIAIIYFGQKNYEKALEYHSKSLRIKEELEDARSIAMTNANLGETLIEMGEYSKALEYLYKSLDILEKSGAMAVKAFSLISIGDCYYRQKQFGKAKKYLKEGIDIAQQTGHLTVIQSGVGLLAKVEYELGNYKKAYQINVLFKEMADSLNNEETVKKITRLEAEYEFKKETDSLQIAQQQELVLLEEKSKRKRNRNFAIGVCIFLAFLTGMIIYISIHKIRRTKELDSLRNHISRDLHDEIGTTLSSLALFGTVATTSIVDNPEKASKMLQLINTNATASVEAMNDIIWAINSEMDTVFNLISKMQSFVSDLSDTEVTDISITYDKEITDINLDMVQRRNVYLIFKEALNNAIKYAKAKAITIEIGMVKNLLRVQIKDNGIGFDTLNALEKKSMFGGNGLKNMKKRAEELKGSVKISSQMEKGTQIVLTFNPKNRPRPVDFNNRTA